MPLNDADKNWIKEAFQQIVDSKIAVWVGPESGVRHDIDENARQIQVLLEKVANLEGKLERLEKENGEMKKRFFQQVKSEKEVILTGYTKNHKDGNWKPPILKIMRKIDKNLEDRHVVKVTPFGAGDFKRLSIQMMSNHCRNTFIDSCIANPSIEMAKNFSRGKTQEERKRNKEKFALYERARQLNREEPDRETYFHYPNRSKKGEWSILRGQCKDQKLKKPYEAYMADRQKNTY